VMPTSVIILAVHFTYQVMSYLGVTDSSVLTTSYDVPYASSNLILHDPFHAVSYLFWLA